MLVVVELGRLGDQRVIALHVELAVPKPSHKAEILRTTELIIAEAVRRRLNRSLKFTICQRVSDGHGHKRRPPKGCTNITAEFSLYLPGDLFG